MVINEFKQPPDNLSIALEYITPAGIGRLTDGLRKNEIGITGAPELLETLSSQVQFLHQPSSHIWYGCIANMGELIQRPHAPGTEANLDDLEYNAFQAYLSHLVVTIYEKMELPEMKAELKNTILAKYKNKIATIYDQLSPAFIIKGFNRNTIIEELGNLNINQRMDLTIANAMLKYFTKDKDTAHVFADDLPVQAFYSQLNPVLPDIDPDDFNALRALYHRLESPLGVYFPPDDSTLGWDKVYI